jgi:predicted permease
MSEFWRRIGYLLNRRRIERELEEEMAAHRAQMEDPTAFGSTLKLREESNDAWGFGWFDRLKQDVSYAARILRRSPGFTLTAVAVLAVGIGLNVTAFGFLNTAMFRPLPGIENAHSVMRLTRRAPGSSSTNISYPAYDFYNRNKQNFSSLFAAASAELTYEETERWKSKFVTPNYFQELGVGPSYGRLESREPGDVVLSSNFFVRRFAGDPSIVGKRILLNRKAARVIGVAASSFQGLDPEGVDAWGFLEDHPHFFADSKLLTSIDMQPLHLYGRLSDGTSPKAAEAAMRPIVDQRRKIAPTEIWEGEYLYVAPGAYSIGGSEKLLGPLLIASTLLLLVLLTACANLGNLLLARSLGREREFSIRTAIGATRGRIIRQLMTESVALALLGALAGLALSSLATTILVRALDWPSYIDAAPDWRVASFAFLSGLFASLLFGLAPALQATRTNPVRAARLRHVLIGAQAAACCVLLILSGLLTRSLFKSISEKPGFAYEQSAIVDPNLNGVGRSGQSARIYLEQLKARISEINGVQSTSIATIPPLGQRSNTTRLPVGIALINEIDPEYFNTMQILLLRGRTFRPGDRDVVILSERTASRLWPNEEALGKEYTSRDGKVRRTVIGIASNAPIYSPGDPDAMEIYLPLQEESFEHALLLVRTENLTPIQKALQNAANEIDSTVIPSVSAMREGMTRRVNNSRSAALTVSALGAVSLSLAVVGFAGLIGFSVTQRTREIGIRLALGATRWQVMRIAFDRLVLPTASGIFTGMVLAAGLSYVLRSELYGLSTIDPLAFLSAPALFLAFALLFSLGPLSRAAKIAPATALRHE